MPQYSVVNSEIYKINFIFQKYTGKGFAVVCFSKKRVYSVTARRQFCYLAYRFQRQTSAAFCALLRFLPVLHQEWSRASEFPWFLCPLFFQLHYPVRKHSVIEMYDEVTAWNFNLYATFSRWPMLFLSMPKRRSLHAGGRKQIPVRLHGDRILWRQLWNTWVMLRMLIDANSHWLYQKLFRVFLNCPAAWQWNIVGKSMSFCCLQA